MPQPRGLLQQFDQMLHQQALLPRKARILVACSGGPDSVALLRLLHGVNQSTYWQWKLIVAHVNHRLRGAASKEDQAFVRKLAREMGMPFCVKILTLTTPASGRISEDAARHARRAALERMARTNRCTVIALGHHSDDQAETVLMRMVRGAGVRGISGMAVSRRLGAQRLVRPLLNFSRQMLRDYLHTIGQPYRTDGSNTDQRFLRNRIRHQLLPLLTEYQPNIRRALVRLAENARLADRAVRQEARPLLATLTRNRQGVWHLATGPLRCASAAALATILRGAIVKAGGHVDHIHHGQLLAVVRAIRHGEGKKTWQFADGVEVRLTPTQVLVRRRKNTVNAPRPARSAPAVQPPRGTVV